MDNIHPEQTEDNSIPISVQEQPESTPIAEEVQKTDENVPEMPAVSAPEAPADESAKKEKPFIKIFRFALPIFISALLVVVCCAFTAVVLCLHWNAKLNLVSTAANKRIDVLQNKLENIMIKLMLL